MKKLIRNTFVYATIIAKLQLAAAPAAAAINLVPEKTKETQELLNACDRALNRCAELQKTKDDAIEAQSKTISDQEKVIGNLKQDSWTKSLLLIGAGIAGALLIQQLGR